MTIARKYQILKGIPGFYHCYSRCVRRGFLMGLDPSSGIDYSHRKEWMVNRLKTLGEVFAIDIYAFAIMSNHWHIVLYADPGRAYKWTDEEIVERWKKLYAWKCSGKSMSSRHKRSFTEEKIAKCRSYLGDISWFMKSVNEPMAIIANTEDGKQGHFWDGRFGSTALTDESAVLAGMAYVDLNPIKAAAADKITDYEYTSIRMRLKNLDWHPNRIQSPNDDGESRCDERGESLRPLFKLRQSVSACSTILASTLQYLDLLESTIPGCLGKFRFVHQGAKEMSNVIGLVHSLREWIFGSAGKLGKVVGSESSVRSFLERVGRKRIGHSRIIFSYLDP